MPGTIQQLTNRHGMSIDGVCNASWLWRVDWTNVGTIFVSELVPHILSHTLRRTTILAVNDTMLLISGKITLTQQSTGIGDWFLAVEDGDRPMWQPTTSDLVVIFIPQNQLLRMEMAAGRVKEQTTIYRMNTYHGYDI